MVAIFSITLESISPLFVSLIFSSMDNFSRIPSSAKEVISGSVKNILLMKLFPVIMLYPVLLMWKKSLKLTKKYIPVKKRIRKHDKNDYSNNPFSILNQLNLK